MSELLPTTQARDLQEGLVDFLRTTFALADVGAQAALEDFLRHEQDGIFKGPYVRLRLPFRPADPGWQGHLDWSPSDFTPYGHQARAFERLTTKPASGSTKPLRRPQPTLVTTGTGSGKTEAFLYPVLDHVLRARAQGVGGIKALVLYPMNALASDQAGRLARLIAADARLKAVTAAIYVGDSDVERTRVSADGLISDRHLIRDDPPDILLTNYKMLDQLLLRREDQPLWRESLASLTYLVLDEFHTYDGAQGTDVAMLLRRLALALADLRGQDGSAAAPLGGLVPVATSATLGDARDPSAMVAFAQTVFGVPFDADCIVTESRQASAEWAGDAAVRVHRRGLRPVELKRRAVEELNFAVDRGGSTDGAALTLAVLRHLWEPAERVVPELAPDLVRAHPLFRALVEFPMPQALDTLAADLVAADVEPDQAALLVANLVAVLSHVRAVYGRSEVSVETHLWIRELTRIDRVASDLPRYRWSDDGPAALTEADDSEYWAAFPAIYCRHCGRSGWGVELAPTGLGLSAHDRDIRAHHAAGEGRFRALVHAPHEAAAETVAERLVRLDVRGRELLARTAAASDEDRREGRLLPVLALLDAPEEESRRDRCPACDQPDGIRFLGSSIATLLSVSLSTLYGAPDLDPREKKALVFTDSVQDAAHRAGFVEARSHALTLRTAMRDAVDAEPISLGQVVERMLTHAGDDPFARYRLLAPDLVGRERFDAYWRSDTPLTPAIDAVRRRLLFDVGSEFGVHSRIGRTLEATGSVVAEVDTTGVDLAVVGRNALADNEHQATLDQRPDADVVAWVRGTLERLRTQGAIFHPWLGPYIAEDGTRFRIWGGRARDQGMPAFPTGRTAPAFPRVGPPLERSSEVLLDAVTSAQAWYARWTNRTLGVPPGHSGRLARALLDLLCHEGVLNNHSTRSQATVYSLDPSKVRVAAADANHAGEQHRLRCTLCQTEQHGSAAVVDQLAGSPCLLVRCTGRLERVLLADNYYRRLYRSTNPKRVVAREHTGMLDGRTRATYERGFASGQHDPSAPNVLVATPTLEMGIDIGDLSSVLLASLPRHVAAYLQRVGRAGRVTGNALDLAFVTGRGEHLPRLGDPLSLIDGPVRPPSTYLSAEEILRRQLLATVVDAFARDEDRLHPRTAALAIGSTEPGSFLDDVVVYAESHSPALADTFLAQLGTLEPDAAAALRDWSRAEDGSGSSGIARQVREASTRWQTTVRGLRARQQGIEAALPELMARAESAAHTEDDVRAHRSALAGLAQTKGALGRLNGEYWVSVLEEYGLLPNYSLLDDDVTLDVALSWLDPERQQYDSSVSTHKRGSAVALHEFAPGATFYTNGMQIQIDALDLGIDAGRIEPWSFCAACGFARPSEEAVATQPCPRCSSTSITDTRQRFQAVEMTRVSAQAHRDEARINDRDDDRRRARFTVVAAADVDAERATSWFVEGREFGARYLRQLTIRWLNIGPRVGYGALREVAGHQGPGNLFRVCTGCGVLDRSTHTNRPDEHRAWCRYRASTDEHTETVLLTRTLTTQGVVLPLPLSVTLGDSYAVPSLGAAVLLGLHQVLGGSPDHLGMTTTVDPIRDGENRDALLLHDLVPGGTGYLADLSRPEQVWRLLRAAWEVVRHCLCAGEGRLACHRCLLPYAPRGRPDTVSRVAAERHLRSILGGSDEPPERMAWTTTTREPEVVISWESHLEQHFRSAFKLLVRELSGNAIEQPATNGNVLHFVLPGDQGRTWVLEPQVQLGQARADFVLRCTDTSIPRVAIFTDGYAFHAAPGRSPADDARVREELAGEHLVLALTADDLRHPGPPSWWREDVWPTLVQRAPTIVGLADGVRGGPLEFLRWWVTKRAVAEQRALADVVPLMLAAGQVQVLVPAEVPLGELACSVLDGSAPAGGTAPCVVRRDGVFGLVVRLQVEGGTVRPEVVAVLDDRAEAMAAPGFADAWRSWLRFANALQGHSIRARIVTRSMLVGSGTVAPSILGVMSTVVVEWEPALDVMVDDAGRELVKALAAAGVVPPSRVGDELGREQIPADLIWDPQHVAVLIGGGEDDVEALGAEGWTVLDADVDAIVAFLAAEGLSG